MGETKDAKFIVSIGTKEINEFFEGNLLFKREPRYFPLNNCIAVLDDCGFEFFKVNFYSKEEKEQKKRDLKMYRSIENVLHMPQKCTSHETVDWELEKIDTSNIPRKNGYCVSFWISSTEHEWCVLYKIDSNGLHMELYSISENVHMGNASYNFTPDSSMEYGVQFINRSHYIHLYCYRVDTTILSLSFHSMNITVVHNISARRMYVTNDTYFDVIKREERNGITNKITICGNFRGVDWEAFDKSLKKRKTFKKIPDSSYVGQYETLMFDYNEMSFWKSGREKRDETYLGYNLGKEFRVFCKSFVSDGMNVYNSEWESRGVTAIPLSLHAEMTNSDCVSPTLVRSIIRNHSWISLLSIYNDKPYRVEIIELLGAKKAGSVPNQKAIFMYKNCLFVEKRKPGVSYYGLEAFRIPIVLPEDMEILLTKIFQRRKDIKGIGKDIIGVIIEFYREMFEDMLFTRDKQIREKGWSRTLPEKLEPEDTSEVEIMKKRRTK